MYCESGSLTDAFLTDITDKYEDGFMRHSPGLYGPHTVNSAGMVSAHTPFLYITAVVSLGGGDQCNKKIDQ